MKLRKPLRLFRIWDVVLIVLLLALVGVTVYLAVAPKAGAFAEVYLDGELYQTLPLNKDAVVELDHLKIVVSGGAVSVKDADCPDKICEKSGAISKAGQTIVCLPNRVVIKITGKGEVEAIS